MATASSSSSSAQPLRILLRVRPFLPSEAASSGAPCVSLVDGYPGSEVTVKLKDQYTSRSEHYNLDAFFGQENSVSEIFDREVSPLIPGIFEGTNATVFAYGATGSGKTFTMQGTEDCPGLIPLAVSTILDLARCTGTWCCVDISYYEVYMERCYDLLEPKAKEIMALEDKDGNLQLKGLCWTPVQSMEEFEELYSIGVQRRKVAHTGLNDVSSRSHAVFSVRVSTSVVKGKLNLIDLAGSEDNRRTMNQGIRLQESSKINQSLLALSNVISALNTNERKIPYRGSKLTRILQDSLGGSSCAVMIACLNPAEYQEAVNTICVAAPSRHIVSYMSSASKPETPKVKVDMEDKLRAWLESKGKTKSIQRTNGLFSPSARKTPSSMSHMKQPTFSKISTRVKAMDQDAVLPSANPCKEVKKSDSSLRRALLPISSNVNQQTSDTDNSSILLEPNTPVVTCNILEKIPAATPLDKFNALGSTLKVGMTLVYFITI
ncbi:hypothetical protein PR202_ga05355 [Eleusine coracana subsp. coracana]|uniref:Kinesin-like protein n=1 Tax=Eleusine coracana subsp. coracana TaxID=191504 RepID=A0AAV5BSX5_ELECO|nr:hypothetical protein PR202_ga04902 [Eleusine coracana subsp. coracana]GJM89191.1 hypothetical protein PR202_ga05355 [Eleusine coracana subsp. coracana]